jgi:hypothetical protein
MILAILVHKFSRLSAFDTLLFALRANFCCSVVILRRIIHDTNLNRIIDSYELFNYPRPAQFR